MDHRPVGLDLAAMALLRPGVLVEPGFERCVRYIVRQRPDQARSRKALQRLAHRRWRQPGPPRDLVLGNTGRTQTQNLAHMAHRNSPGWHQSAPRPQPKSRPYAQPAEAPVIPSHPGDIIPESWARINRNAGRQLIGIGGRHHLGIDGRLAPEPAPRSSATKCSTAFFLEVIFLGMMLFGWHSRVPPLAALVTSADVRPWHLLSAFWIPRGQWWMQLSSRSRGQERHRLSGRLACGSTSARPFHAPGAYGGGGRPHHGLRGDVGRRALSAGRLIRGPGSHHAEMGLGLAHGLYRSSFSSAICTASSRPSTSPPSSPPWKAIGWATRPAPLSSSRGPDEATETQPLRNRHPPSRQPPHHPSPRRQLPRPEGFSAGRTGRRWRRSSSPSASWSASASLLLALAGTGGYFCGGRAGCSPRAPICWPPIVVAWPLGFIAIVSCWMVTEIGRQPWVAHRHPAHRRCPLAHPPAGTVATSLALFLAVYGIVFWKLASVFINKAHRQGAPIARHGRQRGAAEPAAVGRRRPAVPWCHAARGSEAHGMVSAGDVGRDHCRGPRRHVCRSRRFRPRSRHPVSHHRDEESATR